MQHHDTPHTLADLLRLIQHRPPTVTPDAHLQRLQDAAHDWLARLEAAKRPMEA